MLIRFSGCTYDLSREKIETALTSVAPEPGRRFFVEINGLAYPVKQAVATAISRPSMELGTNTAYAALRRLGFRIIDRHGGAQDGNTGA